MFKKAVLAAAAVLCTVLVFSSCGVKDEPTAKTNDSKTSSSEQSQTQTQEQTSEPKIDIKLAETTLEVGKSAALEINKSENCVGEVEIVCDNTDVLKIENNTVTALKSGQAKIYAQCGEVKSNEIIVKCVVFVQSITLDKQEMSVRIGEKSKLGAKVLPDNATDKKLTWKSENKKIATVDSNGNVKGVSVGKTNIVACDSFSRVKAVCAVSVTPIEVTKVQLSDSSVQLTKGQKFILYSSVQPSNATYKTLKWASSNSGVAVYSNGIITATGNGTATITAAAQNGVKASFTVKVSDKKASKTMYSTATLNIRSSASTKAKSIEKVPAGTALEVVKSGKWAMVNTPSGKVGFVDSSYISSIKPVMIKNVPYLNQFSLGLPTGCEAVAATMLLNYYGYNVSVNTIVNATPTGPEKHQVNGVWVGANPFEYFVGHPTKGKSAGSYGCFAKPIVTAMRTVASSRVKNISGCSMDTLLSYVAKGKPVVVWCVKNAAPVGKGVTWKYPDGSGSFTELTGEHCAVLIGYDSENVYLNDPAAGKNVSQPIDKFERNFKQLYSQAIVIE